MKITWSWLTHHLDTVLSPQQIADRLTAAGSETTVISPYEWAHAFRVAHVEAVEKHPQADTLSVCQVRLAGKQYTVVCGARNVRPGMKSILALPGQTLPGAKGPLTACTLRGVSSEGMLCSPEELGVQTYFAEREDGIFDLPAETPEGMSLDQLLPRVLNLEITPNRGDLFSVRGAARELAALKAGQLKPYEFLGHSLPQRAEKIAPSHVHVQTEACWQFYTCLIEGVQNGSSPAWMKQRLQAIGLRPISFFVDLTNYLCHDLGRPLHVFDADTLQGALTVRLSEAGETFEGLDDQIHILPAGLIVIADEGGIISLAGVMGGKRTACQPTTSRVLIESALFDPRLIYQAGQLTHILSEARTRFERGTDPALTLPVLQLIATAMGAATPVISAASTSWQAPDLTFTFDLQDLQTIGGISLERAEALQRLQDVGCTLQGAGQHLQVTPPSWRHDLMLGADCVEEILRLGGYAEIVSAPFYGRWTEAVPMGWKGRQFLVSQGLMEVVTWSFISEAKAKLFWERGDMDSLKLQNPISQDLAVLRPSVLPSLIDNYVYHKKHALAFSPIFEWGPQFFGGASGQQEEMISGLYPLSGPEHWAQPTAYSFFAIKGMVERLLAILGAPKGELQAQGPAWYHPGKVVSIVCNGQRVATIGQLHPKWAQSLQAECWIFEVYVSKIPALSERSIEGFVLPHLQPVSKDLSFLLPAALPVGTLLQAFWQAGCRPMIDLMVIDIFTPENDAQKSVTVRCVFQPQDKTFSEEDLYHLMDQLIQAARHCGAILRGQWKED